MNVGSATLTLYDVPPDASASAAPGGSAVTVSAGDVPGQNAVVRFSGTAGQRVAVRASGVTIGTSACCSFKLGIVGLGQPVLMGRNGGLLDTVRLPSSGVYSLLVDPQGMDAGSATLQIYDVPPDVTGSITPGGAPVTVSTSSLGQNAVVSFAGVAGQRVSLKLSGVTIGASTCCSAKVSVLKPDGSTLVYPALLGTSGGFVDTKLLPVTGTYSIVVDPSGTDVGGATLQLYEVPPDLTGSLVVGGSPVSLTLSTPGQNAVLSFAGAAGQQPALARAVRTHPAAEHPPAGREDEDLAVVVPLGDSRDRDAPTVGRPRRTLDVEDPGWRDVASVRAGRRGEEQSLPRRVVAAERPAAEAQRGVSSESCEARRSWILRP